MEFTIQGEDMVKKTVGKGGNSGIIYVPKAWHKKRVAVILLEEGE